eukprot:CAMPEP_0194400576 /NCGR_PEP_ID=MMETSP0174-20130528/127311_1 /TAXON_ID=216777 /ORGANISM="Proboscia alata, Strain PI-D3" /LENGTH=131 /DNA_ID=CAMNT_0039197147 /DNA_START=504 /DNA_END=899 /DNA_ORIENTATION=+
MGEVDGLSVGFPDGRGLCVGIIVSSLEGGGVGSSLGANVVSVVGKDEGFLVGNDEGFSVRTNDGFLVGDDDFIVVGENVGRVVGGIAIVGDSEIGFFDSVWVAVGLYDGKFDGKDDMNSLSQKVFSVVESL